MTKLSILIPTINESGNIHQLMSLVSASAEKVVGHGFEVIFVDLVRPILDEKKDMVIGSRYIPGGSVPGWSPSRHLASRIATFFARMLTDIRDPLSGYFAVRKEMLLSLGQDVPGFKMGLALLVRGGTLLRTQEVPITFRERKAGQSKVCLPVILSYCYQIIELAGGHLSQNGDHHDQTHFFHIER